jgi:SpoVK/Ycf46/Vps4 family AAA+-type ATPase
MYPSPLSSEASSSSDGAMSQLQWSIPDDMQVSKPVFGCEDAKKALNDAISLPLEVPARMLTGIRSISSSGILLHGPPGTGKTSLARQASIDFHLPLLVVTPGMVVSKWAGESEKKIRLIFQSARDQSPCLLFFDELDALAYSRSGGSSDDDSSNRRLLAELLIQLSNLLEAEDGSASNVVVMGATNRLDDLDPAVQRRFSSRVFVGNPNQQCILELLRYALTGIQVEEDVDLEIIASQLEGWSGADIFSVCREAALRPVRRYHEAAKQHYQQPQYQQQQQEHSDEIDLDVQVEKEKRTVVNLEAVKRSDFDHAVSSVVPVHMSKTQMGRTV